ncbi:MAG: hypothetical protein AAF322_08565, partial [Pseudomonadota bacterium]
MGALSITVAYGGRGGPATPRVSFSAPLLIEPDAAQGQAISQARASGQTGPHTFSLTANAGGRFTITSGGELRVGGTAIGDGPYSITVRATNGSDPAITTTRSVEVAVVQQTPVAPSAAGALADVGYAENGGVRTVNAASDFSDAVDGAWSLPTAPAGVTIDGAGVVSVDTDATGLLTDASVVVRYQNALGTAESAFALTIAEAPAGPPLAPAHFWDFSDVATLTLEGEEVSAATDKIAGVVATSATARPILRPDATATGGPKPRLFFNGQMQLDIPNEVALNSRALSIFCVTRMNHNQWRRNRCTLLSLGTAARDFILMKNQSQFLSVFTTSNNFADVSNSNTCSVSWAIGAEDNGWIGSDGDVFERGTPFANRNPVGGWIGRFTATDLNRGYSGDMQAVLIYDRALTPTERDEVLTWLSGAYSTPGTTDREYVLDGDSITEG